MNFSKNPEVIIKYDLKASFWFIFIFDNKSSYWIRFYGKQQIHLLQLMTNLRLF